MVVRVHLYPSCINFGDASSTFLYGAAMRYFLQMIDSGSIPKPLIGLFDFKNYKNGKLVLHVCDHRYSRADAHGGLAKKKCSPHSLPPHGSESTLVISETPLSMWHDYLRIGASMSRETSEKLLCEIESCYLSASQNSLNLEPNVNVLMQQNLAQYNELKNNFWRSSRAQKFAEDPPDLRQDGLDLSDPLFLLDKRREPGHRFYPTFTRIDLIKNFRRRKKESAAFHAPYAQERQILLPCGKVLSRTMKFKRDNGANGTVYSTFNIYVLPGARETYEIELSWGSEPDCFVNGGRIRVLAGSLEETSHIRSSFSRFFSIQNTVYYDSHVKFQQQHSPAALNPSSGPTTCIAQDEYKEINGKPQHYENESHSSSGKNRRPSQDHDSGASTIGLTQKSNGKSEFTHDTASCPSLECSAESTVTIPLAVGSPNLNGDIPNTANITTKDLMRPRHSKPPLERGLEACNQLSPPVTGKQRLRATSKSKIESPRGGTSSKSISPSGSIICSAGNGYILPISVGGGEIRIAAANSIHSSPQMALIQQRLNQGNGVAEPPPLADANMFRTCLPRVSSDANDSDSGTHYCVANQPQVLNPEQQALRMQQDMIQQSQLIQRQNQQQQQIQVQNQQQQMASTSPVLAFAGGYQTGVTQHIVPFNAAGAGYAPQQIMAWNNQRALQSQQQYHQAIRNYSAQQQQQPQQMLMMALNQQRQSHGSPQPMHETIGVFHRNGILSPQDKNQVQQQQQQYIALQQQQQQHMLAHFGGTPRQTWAHVATQNQNQLVANNSTGIGSTLEISRTRQAKAQKQGHPTSPADGNALPMMARLDMGSSPNMVAMQLIHQQQKNTASFQIPSGSTNTSPAFAAAMARQSLMLPSVVGQNPSISMPQMPAAMQLPNVAYSQSAMPRLIHHYPHQGQHLQAYSTQTFYPNAVAGHYQNTTNVENLQYHQQVLGGMGHIPIQIPGSGQLPQNTHGSKAT